MTTCSVATFEGTRKRANGDARNVFKAVSFLDRSIRQ